MAKNSVKSATQDFSKVVNVSVPRSTFKRNSTLVTTFNASDLVPIYLDEVLPGDTFKMSMSYVSRLLTPFVPTMDNFDIDIYAFFVPNRIVWDNWQRLMGENDTSAWTPSVDPAGVPVQKSPVVLQSKKLGDYYGLPIGLKGLQHNVSSLPFRGYIKIWNDWFRNQNLQAPIPNFTDDTGDQSIALYNRNLEKVNKKHDYFTSALPEPQKGVSQLIPVELNAMIPVITQAISHTTGAASALRVRTISGGIPNSGRALGTSTVGDIGFDTAGGFNAQSLVYPSNLYADAQGIQASTSTINDLRTAFQIQRLYERDARGGTRYVEMLKAHFGVNAGDYRLQRPEFLGHFSTSMDISQVPQTSESGTTPQGNMSAYGHMQGSNFLFNKSFVEHGFIHVFAVARQKKTYQYGIDRFWSRRDRLDYYMPVLAHISEQPIYQKEIFADATNQNTIFGYQEAWSDYRYKPSRVTGQMRSGVTDSFDQWHYADIYTLAPLLSESWMRDNSFENISRTLAVEGADQILFNVRFDLEATRPMPTHSVPGMIDHF